jgi:hypothetical protein
MPPALQITVSKADSDADEMARRKNQKTLAFYAVL